MSRLGNMFVLEVDENVDPTIQPVWWGTPTLKNDIGDILRGSPQPSETFKVQMKSQKKYCVYFTPHENILENLDAAFNPEYAEAEIRYEFTTEGQPQATYDSCLSWTKNDLKNADKYILVDLDPDDLKETNLEFPHKFQLNLEQFMTKPHLKETYTFHFLPPIPGSTRQFDDRIHNVEITVSSIQSRGVTYSNIIVSLTGENGNLSFDAKLDRKFRIRGVIQECDLTKRSRGSGREYKLKLYNSSDTITLVFGQVGSLSKSRDIDELEKTCSQYNVFKKSFDTGNKFILFL